MKQRRVLKRGTSSLGVVTVLLSVIAALLAPSSSVSAATDSVLILGSTVANGVSSIEASEVSAKGFTPVVVDDATWSSMTSAQFSSYRAIILGDPTCSPTAPAVAEANVSTWGPAVSGNIVIAGTDPVFHANQGGDTLTRREVDFAVDQPGKTGAYVALSCYYQDTAAHTPVPLLDAFRPGGFTVTGVGCYNSAHIVATHPALAGLSDADLSNWSCSVHEAFDTWPADFTVLAIAKDFGAAYTASDGSIGTPYILARGSGLRSFPLSIDPISQQVAVGSSATATAQLLDDTTSAPVTGTTLSALVSSGPNKGAPVSCAGSCQTDSAGRVVFQYSGSQTGTDTLQVWVDSNGDGSPSPGEPQTTAAVTWSGGSPPATKYVALGDSYSSGEGNPPFLPPTDGPVQYCHRSSVAYPEVLGTAYHLPPQFYACSGAVTSNITTNSQYPSVPPQITDPGVDPTAALLTLTIGGNNAGFSDVLKACIEQKLVVDFYNRQLNSRLGPVARWLGLTKDPSCVTSASFMNSENSRIDNVYSSAWDTYSKLRSAVGSGTSVIAAGYPHLFSSTSAEQTCLQLSPFLTTQDQTSFNSSSDRLDGVLQRAAAGAGVNFVDPRSTFAGHGICGNSGSYLNAISIASGNGGGCTWSVAGKCIIPGLPLVGSFHPNASGHANGYAVAFENYIRGATSRNAAGFPLNPAPQAGLHSATAQAAASTSASLISVAVGSLTATTPASSEGVACEGTYQAGQRVSFNGAGFAPGTSVHLYTTSPGLGTTGQHLIKTVVADSSGQIATTASVPLGATGFKSRSAAAGLAFVDALGTNSTGSHIDDVAMIGLAPHTSNCDDD